MIAIIDYNVGNLASIKNMLKKIGEPKAEIANSEEAILQADKLILPGVGHYDYGMQQLKSMPFFEALQQRVLVDKIPVLGICLGAQLMLQSSQEGTIPGLGWIAGNCLKFDSAHLPQGSKIPHMGWSSVQATKSSKLTAGVDEESRYYFVHSYYMACSNAADEVLQCNYGHNFTAAFEHNNILGVQFHPEKSHKFGMQILNNFLKHY